MNAVPGPQRPSTRGGKDPEPLRLLPLVKGLAMLLAVAAAIYLLSFSPLRAYLHDVGQVQDTLARTGAAAPVWFVAATTVAIALGLPRLLVCPVAGAVFGFAWGLALSQLATLLGAYAQFLFVRWGGQDWVLRRWPRLQPATAIFEQRGYLAVFLARQLPLGGFFINVILALAPTRHLAFLGGTLLGILPEAIPATLMGAGVTEIAGGHGVIKTATAALVLLAVWVVAAGYLRRTRAAGALWQRVRALWASPVEETGDEN